MMEGSGCLAVMGYRWRKGQVVWLWWDIDDGKVRLFGCDKISMTERSGCLAVMGYRWWKGQVVWLWWDIDDGGVRLFGCDGISMTEGSGCSAVVTEWYVWECFIRREIEFVSHITWQSQSWRLVLVNIISRTINISAFMLLIATFGWLTVLSRCFLKWTLALAITNTFGKCYWFWVLDDRPFFVSSKC